MVHVLFFVVLSIFRVLVLGKGSIFSILVRNWRVSAVKQYRPEYVIIRLLGYATLILFLPHRNG